jgi:hypothetical protein
MDVNTNGSTPVSSGTYSYDFRAPNTTTNKTIASGSKNISRGSYGSYTTNFSGYADGGTGGLIGSATAAGSLALSNIVAPPFFPYFPPFFPYFPPYFPYFPPYFPYFPPFFPFFPPNFTPAPGWSGTGTDVVLATATEGIYYSDGIAASNATSYSITSGSFPSGITFDTSTGAVYGTPATGTKGTYNLTFTASGAGGSTTSGTISLIVVPEPGQLFTYDTATGTWKKAIVNTYSNVGGVPTSSKNTLYVYDSASGQWVISKG